MYSIKFTGTVSAVNLRFPNASEALKAFRRLEEEGHPNIHIVDNQAEAEVLPDELADRAAAEG
jgi:hypothetical protein